jgi:hypothetical protein
MGGRTRGRQIRSFHRRLLAVAEPLTVAAIVCSASSHRTADGCSVPGASPLGEPDVVTPTACFRSDGT